MQTKTFIGVQTNSTCRDRPYFIVFLFFMEYIWSFFLLPKRRKHKTGTDLDLNKASPSFSATALRKTRSMCKQNRSLVFLQTAHAGTDLDLYDFIIVRTIEHASSPVDCVSRRVLNCTAHRAWSRRLWRV